MQLALQTMQLAMLIACFALQRKSDQPEDCSLIALFVSQRVNCLVCLAKKKVINLKMARWLRGLPCKELIAWFVSQRANCMILPCKEKSDRPEDGSLIAWFALQRANCMVCLAKKKVINLKMAPSQSRNM